MSKKIITLLLLFLCFSCKEKIKFNSLEWKNWVETEANSNTRWLMRDDLLNNYDLKTYNKEQIIKLLGKPESNNNNEFNYFLGNSESGINTGTLIIIFEREKVIDVKIIQG